MPEDIRGMFQKMLRTALDPIPSFQHALLCVGTKVLAVASKPRVPELSPSDMNLLIIQLMAELHPHSESAPKAPHTSLHRLTACLC